MPTYTTDPITGILVPTVGSDPGPDYATHISNALLSLAHLTHTGAANFDGYQIPAAGLNVNADLSFQSHNITTLRSARFSSQSAVLNGVGDVNCVYFKSGNAYVNDGNGTPIQLTSGGGISAVSSNNFSVLALSTNHTINSSDTYAVYHYTGWSGNRILTLPLANTVPAGRFYYVKDISGTADPYSGNTITISAAGADTIDGAASFVLKIAHVGAIVMSDGTSNWALYTWQQSNIIGPTANVIATSGRALLSADASYASVQGATDVVIGAVNDVNIEAIHNLVTQANNDEAHTVGRDLQFTVGRDTSYNSTRNTNVYSGGDISISCGNNGGGIATANILMDTTPTVGTINITTGGTAGNITVQTSLGDLALYAASGKVSTAGQIFMPMKAVTSSPYTVDTTSKDYIILVDTTGGAITINLPAATTGRVLIIKGVSDLSTNTITLHRAGSESIEAYAGDYVMNGVNQGVTLANYGGDWFIVATA